MTRHLLKGAVLIYLFGLALRPINGQDGDCSFASLGAVKLTRADSAASDSVSVCNYTLGDVRNGVYSWRTGLGDHSYWVGGPPTDASNSTQGGYVFFETSTVSVFPVPGFQAKAWLKSPIRPPTSPQGNCLRFSYNLHGVSAWKLKLLRVQLVPMDGRRRSDDAADAIVNSILLPSSKQGDAKVPVLDVSSQPWSPFQSVLNHSGHWRDVIDQVWLSSDSTGGQWQTGHVTYSSPYQHAFIYEAVPHPARSQYTGYVAVDDISFTPGPCSYECEFNADFCQWTNDDDGDDFDWSLSRGSLWTHTGPIRDQLSSGNGFNFGGYAFIDSQQPHYAGQLARLVSPVLPATHRAATSPRDLDQDDGTPLCLIFWVHMYGQGIGYLRLLQQRADQGRSGSSEEASGQREIWRLTSGGPRENWFRAQVTLASTEAFQVKLEAAVGQSGYGDIGVDSFRIENGSCPGLPERASVRSGIDCAFEEDLCGWFVTNSQPGIGPLWTRISADVMAGFPEGHLQKNVLATSTNSYILFDTHQQHLNGQGTGGRGYVSSPWIKPSARSQCLSFWVYQASSSVARLGALELVLYEPNVTLSANNGTSANQSTSIKYDSMTSTTLWRLDNHRDEKWFSSQVSFTARGGGFVSFTGVRGDGVRGVIAIDDIALYDGRCPTLPHEAGVSVIDCSFDVHLCGWNVDSETFVTTPTSSSAPEMTTPLAAEPTEPKLITDPPTTDVTSDPDDVTEHVPQTTSFSSTTMELTTTSEVQSLSSTTAAASTPTTSAATQTTTEIDSVMTTVSTTATQTPTTSEAVPTSSVTEPVPTLTTTTETDDSSMIKTLRYDQPSVEVVANGYDTVTSFGSNAIEVLSTHKDGGSKSIIISRPVGRSARDIRKEWREPRIMNRNGGDNPIWRRPIPTSTWSFPSARNQERGQGHATPYPIGVFRPLSLPGASLSSTTVEPTTSTPEATNTPHYARAGPHVIPFTLTLSTKWRLAAKGSSLNIIKDHTFQTKEGGYVYFQGNLRSEPTVTRLFSPEWDGTGASCLTFFFAVPFADDVNTTLTVYQQRRDQQAATPLWRLTSGPSRAAMSIGTSASSVGWTAAQVPVPDAGSRSIVIIEGSSSNGVVALDDIRLKRHACLVRPEQAAVV